MTEKITASTTSRRALEELHPMGRLGEPGDIASAISWLLSPEAGWVTGQVFGVDGDLSTLHPMPRKVSFGGRPDHRPRPPDGVGPLLPRPPASPHIEPLTERSLSMNIPIDDRPAA